MINTILFDLDGTLVDSAEDIIYCLTQAYASVSIQLTTPIDKSIIGPPLREIIKLVTPSLDAKEVESVMGFFRTCYDYSTLDRTAFKEGVPDILSFLSALKKVMYIVTNKPKAPTNVILNKLKMNGFCGIITPDTQLGRHLSKAEMISHVINTWNLKRQNIIMVGDTASDVYAAHEQGISSVAVLNGYGDRKSIEESKPAYLIEKFDGLKDIFEHEC